MKVIDLDCPNCGANLEVDKDNALAHCKYCDRNFEIAGVPGKHVVVNNYYTADVSTAADDLRKRQRNMSICGLALLVLLGLFLGNFAFNKSPGSNTKINPATAYNSVAGKLPPLDPALYTLRTTPESAPVLTFLRIVFHKTNVTAEELGTIKYLRVWRDAVSPKATDPWLFTYSTVDYYDNQAEFDDTAITVSVPVTASDSGEIAFDDLQCFTGLTVLDIASAGGLGRGTTSLKSLTHLKSYIGDTYQTVAGMKTAFAAPSQILNLRLRLYNDDDIAALAEFTSLQSLTAYLGSDVSDVKDFRDLSKLSDLEYLTITPHADNSDISWLSSCTQLRGLTISGAGHITDYSVLYGMPNLTQLRIDNAKELKDIGFIGSMPKLTSLAISNSAVRSLKPLDGRIGITSLTMTGNNELVGMPEIATLTGLTELDYTSYGYGSAVLPGLSKLTRLTKAHISGNHIAALVGTPLTDLSVRVSLTFDCAVLTNFPALKRLSISGNGAYGISNIKNIGRLSALKNLALDDVDAGWGYEGDCGIFNMPALTEMSLNKVSGLEIDTAKLADNAVLQKLSITNCNYLMVTNNGTPVYSAKSTSTASSSEYLPAAYFAPLFPHLTGLTELYLPSAELDDIGFAAKLTNLRVFDISDNYVSDISPLTALSNLTTLYCGKNPVVNVQSLSGVEVLQ